MDIFHTHPPQTNCNTPCANPLSVSTGRTCCRNSLSHPTHNPSLMFRIPLTVEQVHLNSRTLRPQFLHRQVVDLSVVVESQSREAVSDKLGYIVGIGLLNMVDWCGGSESFVVALVVFHGTFKVSSDLHLNSLFVLFLVGGYLGCSYACPLPHVVPRGIVTCLEITTGCSLPFRSSWDSYLWTRHTTHSLYTYQTLLQQRSAHITQQTTHLVNLVSQVC